jgi:hypothetical protein
LPREILFEGASGSQKFSDAENPYCDITYKFKVSPTVYDLRVGDIDVGYKYGWDYFWVQYAETEDEDAHVLSKHPIAAFIEQVYLDAELNLLFS